jgi:hypothetical protein
LAGKRGSDAEGISVISDQISGGKRKAKRDGNTEFAEIRAQRSQRAERGRGGWLRGRRKEQRDS